MVGSNTTHHREPFLVEDEEDDFLVVQVPSPSAVTQALATAARHNVAGPIRRASPMTSPTTRQGRLLGGTSPGHARGGGGGEPDPTQLSYDSLARRPRSNPRTRTPMRYESPLNSDAFHRETVLAEDPPRREGERVTVRPLAGAAVGTALPVLRIREGAAAAEGGTQPEVRPRSHKQGPSHRKIRRWNNDNFVGIAAELAKSKPSAAENLLKAQADAPLYRSIFNPHDLPSSALSKFIEDNQLHDLREKFFRGEIGHETSLSNRVKQFTRKEKDADTTVEPSPGVMLGWIPERLRAVLTRACHSSASAGIVTALEQFLVCSFGGDRPSRRNARALAECVDTLLERPTVTQRKRGGQTVARFHFDAESPTGGFHRLLLHGVAQFHGLQAKSSTIELGIGANNGKENAATTEARLLTVTGSLTGATVRLVDHIVVGGSDL